jgi:very-short-patch-repair endonuclease
MLGFVVDFICFEARLIVEVDGATHSSDAEIARDQRRDAILRENGNAVLRFNNVEVYENLDGVLETIRLKLLALCPNGPAMHTIPSPLVGEG